MKRFASKIKAIETKYNGYKFRSRLEARYAVFFDSLGIQYYYEHEGYSLEGIAYLPDFYLPQHNCFIEIKGQGPTEDEYEKAQLLAIYTGKPIYIFAGNIAKPEEAGDCWSFSYYPPSLWKYPAGEVVGCEQTSEIFVSPEILGLLQRAENLNMSIGINADGNIEFTSLKEAWDMEELPYLIQRAKEQQRFLQTFQLTIEKREDEICQALQSEEGWIREVFDGGEDEGERWHECSFCGKLAISNRSHHSQLCKHQQSHEQIDDSPRLLAAYEAARQARF